MAAAIQTQIIQESVFALGPILMIQITLEVVVLKIQTVQELAVGLHIKALFPIIIVIQYFFRR